MKLFRWNVIGCVGLFAFAGCAAATVHRDALLSRAEFDLKCPQRGLRAIALDRGDQNGAEWQAGFGEPGPKAAIVTGCGQRATYVWSNNTWALTSAVVDER